MEAIAKKARAAGKTRLLHKLGGIGYHRSGTFFSREAAPRMKFNAGGRQAARKPIGACTRIIWCFA